MLASRSHVVQHGEEILQHALDAHLANKIAITIDAPLVVDVLGLQSLQVRGTLGQLLLEFCHFRLKISKGELVIVGRP